MKFSIVTISYNQGAFLERAILSVLEQEGVEVEYIVVDPGSTDGSRDIIARHQNRISRVILEPDRGPADGLNKGFATATGEIYGYLNSDDVFEPGALRRVADHFERHAEVDVVCGHCWVTDGRDNRLRRGWSEPFTRLSSAYGAAIQIQPSTFFRRDVFLKTGGFNVANRRSWDGELMADLFLCGARIEVIDACLSSYRLHEVSITNSGAMSDQMALFARKRFEKLMGRDWRPYDVAIAILLRLWKHLRNPRGFVERLAKGPIYLRGEK
ncbi:glycosyltransferase family 2 protein [Methylosinus sp. Sm6]|uniref:glycosyltransferase family 2 protein n=1 Tax=Methylosinus sp. Sm6 TaxID=2866948 RepID=UPI001C995B0E|nr:glycosyltransferase family 2 protein [Methylosinus sp. Sm6]MBY6243410.1 glycosyltransferase [Methylosinus sp. Sm6]